MYQPVGYVWEGSIYCDDCIGDDLRNADEVGALFSDNATDGPEHCGTCHTLIDCDLTVDGWNELVKRIRDFEFEWWPDGNLDEYRSQWSWHDWYVIPTFAGMMDPDGDIKT